jgi:hypothetical protein
MMGLYRFPLAAALLLTPLATLSSPAQPNLPPPSIKRILCSADLSQPTRGEDLLAAQNNAAAETFFREALQKNETNPNAQLGLVRVLIEENKLVQSQDELAAWKTRTPPNALQQVATGEIAYREADIASAARSAAEAIALDHCEGRALALEAKVDMLNGRYTREALFLKLAHQLRPQDELIWRDWLTTLPLSEHIAQLQIYLESGPHLHQTQRDLFTIQLAELKVHHPGECRILNPALQATIPFKSIYGPPGQSMSYGIDAGFNGNVRLLEVDTGASGITLTAATAKRLGLHPEFYRSLDGVGNQGRSNGYETHVSTIRIGGMTFSDCMVNVLGHSQLNADGLIGADMFSPWVVTLDYPEQQLQLTPLPDRESPAPEDASAAAKHDTHSLNTTNLTQNASPTLDMPDWLHVLRIGNELLVPVRLNQGPAHYFIADTGSSQTTLSLALARETHRAYAEFDTRMWGIGGDIAQVYRVDNTVLQFGQFQLPPNRYDAFDYAVILQHTGLEVSGLLGFPTLSTMKISIDFRDNMVKMSDEPKRMRRKHAER